MRRSRWLWVGMLVGLLAGGVAPEVGAEDEPLVVHEVGRTKEDPSNSGATYKVIRFHKDEPFQFMVDERMLSEQASDGVAFAWDHDGQADTPPVRLVVPRGVHLVRTALLAAKAYWDQACKKAGLVQTWAKQGPMDVWLPNVATKRGERDGVSLYTLHSMMIYKNHLDAGTAIHEYFHMVQGAVWTDGRVGAWEAKREHGLWAMLSESTATWAQDIPLRVDLGHGAVIDPDAENSYLSAVGQFWRISDFSVLQRAYDRSAPHGMVGYLEGLFVTYLAEQCAGGKDPGDASAILKWFAACMRGDLSARDVVRRTGEMVPVSFGPSWQERWRALHKAWRMSNVVQRGGAAPKHAKRLGYFDDAFQSFTGKPKRYKLGAEGVMYPVYLGPQGVHVAAHLTSPRVLETSFATDDAERIRRLAPGLESHILQPQGCRTRLVPLAPNFVGTRPIKRVAYVMAEGDGPIDAYLLEQRTRDEDFQGRETATFTWHEDFALDPEAGGKRAFKRIEYEPVDGERAYLWVGFVNQDLDRGRAEGRWTYVNVPQLVPYLRMPRFGRASETVRLVGGSAFERGEREGMRAGDTFVFEFDMTGQIHFGALPQEEIPPRELMAKAKLLGPKGQPVLLDGPVEYAARRHPQGESDGRVRYTVSGRIAEHNTVTGACRFELHIETLLRLDASEVQHDDSLAFQIVDSPQVERVRVVAANKLVYDSDVPLRSPGARSTEQGIDLEVEVRFLQPMEPSSVRLGFGATSSVPGSVAVERIAWTDASTCRGVAVISKAQLPTHGVLTLSVAGTNTRGIPLDTDVIREGAQPDTRHRVLVDVPETCWVTLDATTRQERGRGKLEVGPIRVQYLLSRGEPTLTQSYLRRQGKRIVRDIQKRQERVAKRIHARRQELESIRDGKAPPIAALRQRTAVELATRRSLIDDLRAGRHPEFDRLSTLEHLALEDELALLDANPTTEGYVEVIEKRIDRMEGEVRTLTREGLVMEALERVLGAARVFQGDRTALEALSFAGARRVPGGPPRELRGSWFEAESDPAELSELVNGEIESHGGVTLRVLETTTEDLARLDAFLEAGPRSPLRSRVFHTWVAQELWSYEPSRRRPTLEDLEKRPRFPDSRATRRHHLSWSRNLLRMRVPARERRARPSGRDFAYEESKGTCLVLLKPSLYGSFSGDRAWRVSPARRGEASVEEVRLSASGAVPELGTDGQLEIATRPEARMWHGHRETSRQVEGRAGEAPLRVESSIAWRVEHLGRAP